MAAVAFHDRDVAEATRTDTSRIAQLPKAVQGQLDLRDLPCFLQLLQAHALTPKLSVNIVRAASSASGPLHAISQVMCTAAASWPPPSPLRSGADQALRCRLTGQARPPHLSR